MKKLKRLALATALTPIIALTVLAGEVQSPACAPPDPGEVHAPPCEPTQLTSDDPTPPNSSAVTQYVVADAAIDFVESVLSLF